MAYNNRLDDNVMDDGSTEHTAVAIPEDNIQNCAVQPNGYNSSTRKLIVGATEDICQRSKIRMTRLEARADGL